MLSKFDYVRPNTLTEALDYLEQHAGDSKILAGGTDLLVLLRRNLEMPAHVLDIKGINETKVFKYTAGEGLFIGASVTVNQVAESDVVNQRYTALAEAAQSLASYQLRNRATLVGNICNASPGGDLSGPLLVFEAKVHIASKSGKREVAISEFFTGVKKTVLQPGEIVVGVALPDVTPGDCSLYYKQTRIKGHDLGIVGLAARWSGDRKFFLAMSSVAPTPIRLTELEQMLNSQPPSAELAVRAAQEVKQQIRPISDVRSSAQYRLHLAGIFVKRAVGRLLEMGGIQDVR